MIWDKGLINKGARKMTHFMDAQREYSENQIASRSIKKYSKEKTNGDLSTHAWGAHNYKLVITI